MTSITINKISTAITAKGGITTLRTRKALKAYLIAQRADVEFTLYPSISKKINLLLNEAGYTITDFYNWGGDRMKIEAIKK